MTRSLFALFTLLAVGASTAAALEYQKDTSVPMKPPIEQRVNQASFGVSDTLIAEETSEAERRLAQRDDTSETTDAEGAWRSAPSE